MPLEKGELRRLRNGYPDSAAGAVWCQRSYGHLKWPDEESSIDSHIDEPPSPAPFIDGPITRSRAKAIQEELGSMMRVNVLRDVQASLNELMVITNEDYK